MTSRFQKAVYQTLGGEAAEEANELDDRLAELEQLSGPPKKTVGFRMTPVEVNQFYHDIVQLIKTSDAHQSANAIIAHVQSYLSEKQKEAYGVEMKKGLIRRSEY